MCIHSVEAVYPAFPFQLEVFQTSLAQHCISHPFAMMANTVSMIETAVPVRWPDLRIGIMEAGVTWIPFIINRLDKESLERRREVRMLQDRPSTYIRQWYFGTQLIEEPQRRSDIVKIFELFDGANRAMFASDWPHHDFDHPQHVFGLPFHPEARRKIMGETLRASSTSMSRSGRVPREYLVGRTTDLPDGSHRIVRAGNREIGLFKIHGEYHAIPNLCPHQRGPLCSGGLSGTIDYGPHTGWKLSWAYAGEVVTCPWHSLEFHVPTGRCIAFPDVQLRKFKVHVMDGEIKVVI